MPGVAITRFGEPPMVDRSAGAHVPASFLDRQVAELERDGNLARLKRDLADELRGRSGGGSVGVATGGRGADGVEADVVAHLVARVLGVDGAACQRAALAVEQ